MQMQEFETLTQNQDVHIEQGEVVESVFENEQGVLEEGVDVDL